MSKRQFEKINFFGSNQPTRTLRPYKFPEIDREHFDWNALISDKQRIKATTKYCEWEGLTIAQAFAYFYDIKLKSATYNSGKVNDAPKEVSVGDIIRVTPMNISKRKTLFESGNQKSAIYTNGNFSSILDFDTTYDALVLEIDSKNGIKVDLYAPFIQKYIIGYSEQPWLQKPVETDKVLIGNTVRVHDLKLIKGGYIGKATIPGDGSLPIEVDAFIPGSQIVLNIAFDFDKFEGQTVDAFIINYIRKRDGQISIVCSRKEWLKYMGDQTMMGLFDKWCAGEAINETEYEGVVTGVINSSKKCGVFVELPKEHITGMINVQPSELVNYQRGSKLQVTIEGFEEEMYFNPDVQQLQHVEPFETMEQNGTEYLTRCSLKPILKSVK